MLQRVWNGENIIYRSCNEYQMTTDIKIMSRSCVRPSHGKTEHNLKIMFNTLEEINVNL